VSPISSSPSATAPRTIFARILAEGPLPIVEAAAANGIKLHPKSALRQAIAGSGGARLESVKLNGKRLTSAAAYRRFLEAQQREPEQPAQLDPDDVDRALSGYGLARDGARATARQRGRRAAGSRR
jgi:hypothetical protein